MNKIFAIGIPTINQVDFLEPALKLYADDFPNTKIYILDNGLQNFMLPNTGQLEVVKNYDRYSISKSWNWLAKKIYEHSDNALILNDDIYLGKGENVIAEMLKSKSVDLYCAEHICDCFSAFVLPKRTFEKYGGFDEEYTGCYYEDSDYLRWLTVSNNASVLYTHELNSTFFKRNSSITKDPSLNSGRQINERRYIQKWDGAIGDEQFKTPFGK